MKFAVFCLLVTVAVNLIAVSAWAVECLNVVSKNKHPKQKRNPFTHG